jgi:hypothetical protein
MIEKIRLQLLLFFGITGDIEPVDPVAETPVGSITAITPLNLMIQLKM